jgi:sialate O-acetylesterase
LNGEYGKAIVPSGPLPAHAEFRNGKVIVSFRHSVDGLHTSDAKEPRAFSIDGITEISARINDSTIEINSPVRPAFIYYGWKPYSNGNLINADGLPASSFKIPVH